MPGPPVFTVIRSGEPGPVSPIEIPSSRSRSNATVCSAVGARCGRIQVGTAICTKMTKARVTAIAGSVRRNTAPRVAPSTTANTAYPTGTMPRIANDTGVRRDGRLPWVLLSAPSSGCDHQVTAKVSTPDGRGGGERRHAELGGQPPGAGDRLGPGQPVGAGLELAGDERRAPEHADDHRCHGDDDDPGVEEVAVGPREVVEDVAVRRGDVGQPWTGRGQDQREGDRDGRDGRGLGAELAPGEPDHRRTSITGPGATARVPSM